MIKMINRHRSYQAVWVYGREMEVERAIIKNKKIANGSMVPESLLHTYKRTHTYRIAVP